MDTYDITAGIATAVKVAGPDLGAVRIDSGDLGVLTRAARRQLDGLGAPNTKIVLSGDLDEYAIAALRADPVDVYGVGTSLVTGSGAPTAGMVYKLVEVDGRPVEKRSADKVSHGGRKSALRRHKASGTVDRGGHLPWHRGRRAPAAGPHDRVLPVPLVRGGRPVDDLPTWPAVREHLRHALTDAALGGTDPVRGRTRHPQHPLTATDPLRGTDPMTDTDDRPTWTAPGPTTRCWSSTCSTTSATPSGSLYVRGGEDIVEPIARAIEEPGPPAAPSSTPRTGTRR